MAAVNQPTDTTILDTPVDILCSYHYFSTIDMSQIHGWGTRIIGDSGAFSAMSGGQPIDREEFHEWAHRWRDNMLWTAALDVIGDPDATYRNWLAARRDGLELVPTLHYGEPPETMDQYAEDGASLIGLGGMVPYSSEKDRLMRWCLSMHRYARDNHPHVRFHGWGISHPYLLDNLPWWSTDSSGFSSCFRFGTLRLWHPRRYRFYSVELNGRDLAKYSSMLTKYYSADWRTIATSTPDNRRPLGRVALRSVQLYGDWLRSRQRVTPPALLADRLTSSTGPWTFGAMGDSFGAQGMAFTPDGSSIKQAAGPHVVAAVVVNEPIQNCLGAATSSDLTRVKPGPTIHAAVGGDTSLTEIRP